ncbi:MAG: entericidin A/B family lipoprotein [Pseudoxanthomonas sp.]
MKRAIPGVVLMMLAAMLVAGCNTVAGVGKDVQKAGEKVEDTAEKHQN